MTDKKQRGVNPTIIFLECNHWTITFTSYAKLESETAPRTFWFCEACNVMKRIVSGVDAVAEKLKLRLESDGHTVNIIYPKMPDPKAAFLRQLKTMQADLEQERLNATL